MQTEKLSFTVRPATREDARAIAEVSIASWRAAYAGILDDDVLAQLSVDDRAVGWKERFVEMGPRGFRIWVAHVDGRVRGFAFSRPTEDDDLDPATIGELVALYIEPATFGTGMGTALMERSIAGMRQQGFLQATLWVLEDNARAIAFYRREGWKPDGTRSPCFRVFNAPALRFRYAL